MFCKKNPCSQLSDQRRPWQRKNWLNHRKFKRMTRHKSEVVNSLITHWILLLATQLKKGTGTSIVQPVSTSEAQCRTKFCAGQPSDTLSYDPKCPHSVSDSANHDVRDFQSRSIPVSFWCWMSFIFHDFQSSASVAGCGGRSCPPSPSSPASPWSPPWLAGPGTEPSMMDSLTGW